MKIRKTKLVESKLNEAEDDDLGLNDINPQEDPNSKIADAIKNDVEDATDGEVKLSDEQAAQAAEDTKEAAKEHNVEIRLYNIIYKLVEEIEAAMKGMLDPEFEEIVIGEAEVRQIFHFSKVGNIAGCHVTSGVVKVNTPCRIIRDGIVVATTKIATLQREKDQAKEVKQGFDCGMTIEDFPDIKEKDIIEAYEVKEVKRI